MSFFEDFGAELSIISYTNAHTMLYTHIHPHYELYFCPDDIEQTAVVNGVQYTYTHPAVILSPPYAIHSMSSAGKPDKRWYRFIVYFGGNTMKALGGKLLPLEFFEQNTSTLFELTPENAAELKKITDLIDGCRSVTEKELAFAVFMNRLVAICPNERIHVVGSSHFYVQDVLKYISESFSNDISLPVIAKTFAVSRSKLDRDFKKFTGVTVHGYIDMCRLNQAKYLLQYEKNMSIRAIAKACGFKNENYFFPFFKKAENISPSDYRKKYATHRR